ncbi:Pfam:Acid phosphat A [Geosmithia morbida]|uniref:Pfam:Acid phosphat A n=1 Tax=Geosmithia morbida TaxID=1094350 RepID=A0A9P4YY74_9HYPO|nr:Pfam:Acid phosphat A [Geosmithia morbida]KAF4125273.1 Pfam:Acid phosphat A [Geosmithia morbida]
MVSAGGGIIIAIVLVFVLGAIGWVLFTQLRARNLGLPTPSLSDYLPWKRSGGGSYSPPRPASGGVVGWFNQQVQKVKGRGGGGGGNQRSARGAYEQQAGGGSAGTGHRGFGPLDPDEAWDTRVDDANDYEHYERGRSGAGTGANRRDSADSLEYQGAGAYEGINLSSSSGPYGAEDEERGRRPDRRNPFDDDAGNDSNLRGMSPRPTEGHDKSTFREQV